jgi:hypothetical protein
MGNFRPQRTRAFIKPACVPLPSITSRLFLHLAAICDVYSMQKAIDDNDVDTVRQLLSEGYDVRQSIEVCLDIYPNALFYACLHEHFELFEYEVQGPVTCEPNSAANSEIISLLLKAPGIDVNEISSQRYAVGRTALHLLAKCYCNTSRAIKILIENGADTNVLDQYNCAPLFGAILVRQHHRRKSLGRNREGLMVLIDQTNNLTTHDMGETILHYAAEYWDGGAVSKLVEKGADIEAKSIYGDTPLHFAAYDRNISALQALLKNGADVKARNVVR